MGESCTTYLNNVILSVAKNLYPGKYNTLRSRTPAPAGGAGGSAPSHRPHAPGEDDMYVDFEKPIGFPSEYLIINVRMTYNEFAL